MNKFVISALAATLVGATSYAADSGWSELDSELAELNNAPLLTQGGGGPTLGGWLITALHYNSDSESTGAAGTFNDAQGFMLPGVRLNLTGSVGNTDYGYKIGMDFTDGAFGGTTPTHADGSPFYMGELYGGGVATGGAGVTDAYGTFKIGDQLNGQIGVFRMPFLRSEMIDRNHTLFIDRSFLGAMYSHRDAGVQLGGTFNDKVNWAVAVMNGADGMAEGWAYGARVDVDVMGTHSEYEGCMNAAQGTNLNVGLAYQDDTADTSLGVSSRNVSQFAVDATLTMENFSVFGEFVNQDDDVNIVEFDPNNSNSPFSIGASYMFNEEYEAAIRYDDWDDANNTARYTGVVNRYIDGGDAKWQLQFSTGTSDSTATNPMEEDTIISLGLALGF